MENVQMAQVAGPKKNSQPWKEARPKNLAHRPTGANPTALLSQCAMYNSLKMNKSWVIEICEQRHLIQRPIGSDKDPKDSFLTCIVIFTKIMDVQLMKHAYLPIN